MAAERIRDVTQQQVFAHPTAMMGTAGTGGPQCIIQAASARDEVMARPVQAPVGLSG